MTTRQDLPDMASENPGVFDMNKLLLELQAEAPLSKVRTFAGDEAWLVTRHAELVELMTDKRLGRTHPDPPNAPKYVNNPFLDMLILKDPHEAWSRHQEMRSALTSSFSARRILNLTPRLEAIVDETLDDFIAKGQPGDLHGDFTAPLTLSMLCELIGVPRDDRGRLVQLLAQMSGVEDHEGVVSGQKSLFEFMGELVERKRADPQDDVVSRLGASNLATDRVIAVCSGLLFAGFDSVVTHLDFGAMLFTRHSDQLELALSEPKLMAGAVEEVLRWAKAGGSPALPRYAIEDIEVAGETIKAGELVLMDFSVANVDERVFDSPETFDVTRSPNPHLTFGHGIWHCVGAPLARVELKIAYTRLFTRLPELRLAKPVGELSMHSGQLAGGLTELPVNW